MWLENSFERARTELSRAMSDDRDRLYDHTKLEDDLASNLYFMRCDGCFRNNRGETLITNAETDQYGGTDMGETCNGFAAKHRLSSIRPPCERWEVERTRESGKQKVQISDRLIRRRYLPSSSDRYA